MNPLHQDLSRLNKRFLHAKKIKIWTIAKYFTISKGFRAIFFYRLLHTLEKNDLRIFKTIIKIFNHFMVNIEISYKSEIGPGLLIPHPQCIVIGGGCIIGSNLTIQQGVTIGGNLAKMKDGRKRPIIGNNVLIGAGAKILGPISIGDNSIIGANAVVINDIPSNSIVVGIPGKIVGTVHESYTVMLNSMQ